MASVAGKIVLQVKQRAGLESNFQFSGRQANFYSKQTNGMERPKPMHSFKQHNICNNSLRIALLPFICTKVFALH